MKKLGCAKCGGTKKMKLGGSAVAKAPVNIYGIPQENMGTSSQMGFGKKGGTVKKEHVLTTFRKANDARNERVIKSLPKAKDGMSTSTLATELYGTKKETVGNNVNTYRVLDNKGRTIGVRPSSKIAATKENVGKPRVRAGVSAKTPAAPKSANPTREPRIKFGDPMVGIPASTPKPKGRYEDAVINTKSPSTKTAAIPRSSAKARKPDPKGKIAMFADALSRGAENMMKKNGGAVKSKKKK